MQKNMLLAKLAIHGDKMSSLAQKISLSPQRLSAKINSYRGAEFTQGEIAAIKHIYNLSDKELCQIFFV